MFEMPLEYVLVLIVNALLFLFLVVALAKNISRFLQNLAMRLRRKSIEEIKLEIAVKAPNLIFYTNQNLGVMALAWRYDFEECLQTFEMEAWKGNIKCWELPQLRVQKTFTFAKSVDQRRAVHTGLADDLVTVFVEYLWLHLQIDISGFSLKERREILESCLVRDSRLFVPYSGTLNKEQGQFQYHYFHYQTMEVFKSGLRWAMVGDKK